MKPANRKNSKKAFSLIELLVAITVIAVLLGISIAVGSKILGKSSETTTKANLAMIMNAIETYRDDTGAYPFESSSNTSSTTKTGTELYTTLKANTKALEKIKGLPDDAFQKNATGAAEAFVDGYGTVIRFYPVGGLGGTPVLVSAGKDKDFTKTDDNIRSDR